MNRKILFLLVMSGFFVLTVFAPINVNGGQAQIRMVPEPGLTGSGIVGESKTAVGLDECLVQMNKQNPEVLMQYYQVEYQKNQLTVTRSKFFPSLNLKLKSRQYEGSQRFFIVDADGGATSGESEGMPYQYGLHLEKLQK